jgi:hypothetical protein
VDYLLRRAAQPEPPSPDPATAVTGLVAADV